MMGLEEILFEEIGRSKSRIPVMNDGVRVGTADLGRNGMITIHLFGPFGRELEKLFVLGEFNDFSFYPNSLPGKELTREDVHICQPCSDRWCQNGFPAFSNHIECFCCQASHKRKKI